jgi:hypothetical protein
MTGAPAVPIFFSLAAGFVALAAVTTCPAGLMETDGTWAAVSRTDKNIVTQQDFIRGTLTVKADFQIRARA